MLIVITGTESINKRLIARQTINGLMGPFRVDDYYIDFTLDSFDIVDLDGNPVTTQDLVIQKNNKGIKDPVGTKTLEKMNALEDELFFNGGMQNHYHNRFADVAHDWGVTSSPEWISDGASTEDLMHYKSTFKTVIDRYKGRNQEHQVISGLFCLDFLERLRAELGNDQVQVYNITRNPSVVYYLHKKDPSHFNDETDYTEFWDSEKLYQSLLTCAKLKTDPKTITVKFEDMIRTEQFIVNGVNVGLYMDYNAFNDYITRYEATQKENYATADDIEAFNEFAQNFSPNVLDEEQDLEERAPQLVGLNIFDALGYGPLTYDQIVVKES